MKEIIIKKNDAGSRFDKYLKKLFVNASSGFIYKMLRKKNITLNGQKSEGKEILNVGDKVCVFFSDETFDKFTADQSVINKEYDLLASISSDNIPEIIFESEDILLVNKPKNMLSQKAKPEDISINEILLSYLIHGRMLSKEEFETFRPSVCNRLDQNTTGLLIFGKTKKGLQDMAYALKERSAHKYYYAVCSGNYNKKQTLSGYLCKNEANNTVSITDMKTDNSDYIETKISGIVYNEYNDTSLIEIELITGKTHQIRAHLASVNHPIIGDYKYGNRKINDQFKNKFQIDSQLLHAYRITIPNYGEFKANPPKEFDLVINERD